MCVQGLLLGSKAKESFQYWGGGGGGGGVAKPARPTSMLVEGVF